ncbi:MAG: sulfotransferase [marine bacterium B5-7]|nr:MAG: sulfotransferase [marine bacterium B5-7]
MAEDRLPLIYIVGGWHSGSTILSILLGTHSNIESIGELNAYERRLWTAKADSSKCACGEVFTDCNFWSGIRSDLGQRLGNPDIVINSSDQEAFCNNNTELFRQVLARSGKQVICDSSKAWLRLKRIAECDRLKPFIVYLVRDARAVGFSALRKGRRVGKPHANKYQYENAIKHWSYVQGIVSRGLANISASWLLIRYEDLLEDPKHWLSLILSSVGLEFESGQLDLTDIQSHQIEGNRLRHNRQMKLQIDNEYMAELSDEQWHIGTQLAQPFLSGFGYELGRERA